MNDDEDMTDDDWAEKYLGYQPPRRCLVGDVDRYILHLERTIKKLNAQIESEKVKRMKELDDSIAHGNLMHGRILSALLNSDDPKKLAGTMIAHEDKE